MLINPLGIGPFNLLSLSRLSKQGNKLAFEKVLEKKLQNTVPRGGQWMGRCGKIHLVPKLEQAQSFGRITRQLQSMGV